MRPCDSFNVVLEQAGESAGALSGPPLAKTPARRKTNSIATLGPGEGPCCAGPPRPPPPTRCQGKIASRRPLPRLSPRVPCKIFWKPENPGSAFFRDAFLALDHFGRSHAWKRDSVLRSPSVHIGGPSFPTLSANRRAGRWADHGYGAKASSS